MEYVKLEIIFFFVKVVYFLVEDVEYVVVLGKEKVVYRSIFFLFGEKLLEELKMG